MIYEDVKFLEIYTWRSQPPSGADDLAVELFQPKGTRIPAHTVKCEFSLANRVMERLRWLKLWHNYCTCCEALGQVCEEQDLGTWYMYTTLEDLCPVCLSNGFCPRCSTAIYPTKQALATAFRLKTPCPVCGWAWCTHQDDALPPPWECYCWENYGWMQTPTSPI